ncbi:uncharacterized protein IWZ02DRAFT_431126 [Phyllosticta citriasiana]|uniref:uncharacterized protein n=1 Tax=Phyllosticta citriasiana TaxID=595635 RepID=UPI0030FD3308
MLSLLRPRKGRRQEHSPFSTHRRPQNPHRDRSFVRQASDRDEDEDDEDDEDDEILPFYAEHLDRLPVYSITHSIRILVVQRCETTLSWDQLRSPQISQFLVKPIQIEIRDTLFSSATLYALIANSLQFQKEGQANPGNVGVCKTRAMICELLAMRLLKEYSTRELIDALSYDFDPLQGLHISPANGRVKPLAQPRLARISTVEIAIRAQAKKFLAHPIPCQILEGIWNGTVVIHSALDALHRAPERAVAQYDARRRSYGTMDSSRFPGKRNDAGPIYPNMLRRTVTLYDPREASLFKLSRLRVPRYRQLFSTLSFAIMLGLFVAVLVGQSLDITALEVIFWFWSAGYMLDEVVGFTEQGFNLYIQSVWNAFDLGILGMMVVYYVLRLYGILMPDVRKQHVANMAYDVLASTAVLLFPRLFSVLDHYRYFSQLLIAFRMMAMDLFAVLVLILISCSGFFVAFSLAFGDKGLSSPASAAYALFQLLMGFTPAAWDIWGSYNPLGKSILVLFLFVTHYCITTILITVLTNSFMAIVQNANEEHQFLFAVNTISMVKSDALFSYIPPSNIVGWLLTPLRFVFPFRRFLKMNRTLIKITHLPILFTIWGYERLILARLAFQPEELVEQRGRSRSKVPAFSLREGDEVFSPGTRLREPSITTFHKDRALEEVFRRPFRGPTLNRKITSDTLAERRKSSNVVRDWMQGVGHEGGASPPLEEPRSVLERLEQTRRPSIRRIKTAGRMGGPPVRRMFSTTSDPDLISLQREASRDTRDDEEDPTASNDDHPHDGDDELGTNDDLGTNAEDEMTLEPLSQVPSRVNYHQPQDVRRQSIPEDEDENYFKTPVATTSHTPLIPSSNSSKIRDGQPRPLHLHSRNLSTNTILFSPMKDEYGSSRTSDITNPPKRPGTAHRSGTATPHIRTPKRPPGTPQPSQSRPIIPNRFGNRSSPNIVGFGHLPRPSRDRNPSFNALALDLASDLGDNRPRDMPDAMAASFSTQMEMAALRQQRLKRRMENDDDSDDDEDRTRMNKIMLARMNNLEESFREVLQEVRGLNRQGGAGRDKKGKGKKGAKTPGTKTPGSKSPGTKTPRADFDKSARPGSSDVAVMDFQRRRKDGGNDDDDDDDDDNVGPGRSSI